jgi:hypothetical protein
VRRPPPALAPVPGQFGRLLDEPELGQLADVIADGTGRLVEEIAQHPHALRPPYPQLAEQPQAEGMGQRSHRPRIGEPHHVPVGIRRALGVRIRAVGVPVV